MGNRDGSWASALPGYATRTTCKQCFALDLTNAVPLQWKVSDFLTVTTSLSCFVPAALLSGEDALLSKAAY